MQWTRNVGEHSTVVTGIAESTEWRPLGRELGAFWETLCEEIETAGFRPALKQIILELSIEMGQFLAYVVLKDKEPKLMVSVQSQFLLKQYAALPDPKADPEGFARKEDILKLDTDQAIDRGAREKGAKVAIRRLRFKAYISHTMGRKPHYFFDSRAYT